MLEKLQHYYLNKEEPNKSCLLALRSIILAQDADITETQKYGMPCFCYKKKMFCYLWTDKKTDKPYVLMVEGNYLDHPELEQGDRTRMKIFRVDSKQRFAYADNRGYFANSLGLVQNGSDNM